ncbi:hypothetical protein SFC57_24050 [Niallia circulans]|uniref:hypothetical protein n=1 Tax=Bacillaceae TaxID=186817 RepID=UPI00397BCE8A
MKKWLNRNKTLLIIFSITTIILIVLTYFQLNFIIQHLPELQQYAETGEISQSLSQYGTIGIFNLIVFGIWALLMILVLWKAFFPTKESAKNAFHLNDMEYIFGLPSRLKRELKKDE